MAPKHSKFLFKFDLVIKEIKVFEENVTNCDDNKSRIEHLITKVKGFENNLENFFLQLTEIEADDKFNEYIKCKNLLLNWTVDLKNKLPKEDNIKYSDKSLNVQDSGVIKLPKLEIPNFYGNNENWISFKEIFTKSILENKTLSKIQKLTYLQSTVRGDASKLIRGFAITEDNLDNCWEILSSRFENKRQLAITHINRIFNMKIGKALNSKLLLEIIDITNESIRNLKTLGLENNKLTDLIIINFLASKLEDDVSHRWELEVDQNTFPNLEQFKLFIERESRSLNKNVKHEIKKAQQFQNKPMNPNNNFIKKSYVNNAIVRGQNSNNEVKNPDVNVNKEVKSIPSCIMCPNQAHAVFKCPNFNSMSVTDRWKVVKNNKLCPNCLRNNHCLETCRIGISCKNCSARHHTLLHVYAVNQTPDTSSKSDEIVSNTCAQSETDSHVLLSTALIKVKSKEGKLIICRALIDNASQNTLISKQCADLLNLPLRQTTHRLIGINATYAEQSIFSTEFEFSSHFSTESFKVVNALVVSKVTTSLPNFNIKGHNWQHIKDLTLADPTYYVENDIDILLGADIYLSLITGIPIMGPKGTPSALPTKLGHLLSGKIHTSSKQNSSLVCHTLIDIDHTLKEFWELESIPKSKNYTSEDELCEAIFANSHTRDSDGRYTVKLPFKENSSLGDSKEGALKRFQYLERKLQADKKLRDTYIEFMQEYESLGHMTPLSSDLKSEHYFLPHHGVMNDDSTTTKLRVVFDGSFKSSNGKALNDILLKGKKQQSDIFVILLKFRTFPVAFTADIAKMYRQINVSNEDTSYQQIFWRKSPTEPLKIYNLNTVTYGTSCAPFLAIRTLHQLCQDELSKFPLAAKLAQEHFYVDDLLAGADTIRTARVVIGEFRDLMLAGGFELRKWSCSHEEVLSEVPDSLKASNFTHSFQEDSSQKILGLYWDLKRDSFQVRAVPADNISTKRQLLSIIARTFDPLGFVAPSTIILKIILQDLWKANLDWDDQLPIDILNRWNKFHAEIEFFKEIKIPRYMDSLHSSTFEIHGFCDSSLKAYAAVIYVRIISNSSRIFLVAAKTRVAPVQSVTLPRLELCGTLLLAELFNKLKEAIKITIQQVYLWSDSTIALGWINNPPTKGNPFVQHRVHKIHSLTAKNYWHHIPGKSNIADCASRGLYPKQLLEKTEWFNGPNWLYEFDPVSLETDTSVVHSPDTSNDSLTNSLNTISLASQNPESSEFVSKFSSYLKLIRTIAWIFRFYHNSRNTPKITGPLKSSELATSIKAIVKSIQKSAFFDEIKLIKSNKSLPKSCKILALNPFLDEEGILRVGGRLRHQQDLSYNQKFPMLIPKHHHFTKLIIRHFHVTNFHAGQELVLSLIRQIFWIPDGKSTVRKETRKCINCCKISARPISQIMGDLPPDRINPARAFAKVGIDFAGPFFTKCQHARKATRFKSYLCIFVCMCTKSIHLELVSSLSTVAFLAAFRRFVSRRGCPSDVYSDNATNFSGASAYLKSLFKLLHEKSVQDYTSQRNIHWHFIPPYTPNFGGLWEASVKLTKHHLLKSCKAALLTFEELTTLLCQIEACLNSRPLYPLSSNSTDFQVLTPGHFLIGCPLLEIPDSSTNHSRLSFHSRWSLIQQLKKKFWERWSTAYLNTLQPRTKWMKEHHQIQIGMLVLVKEPMTHSTIWNIGRIEDIHPGPDNIVRVITIRTPSGLIKRPVSQISILPMNEVEGTLRPPEDVDFS